MSTINEVYNFLTEYAPLELQEDYDNAGFLFGDRYAEITKVLMSLDVTSDVISEAEKKGANLIISHHPLIFGKISNVINTDPTGKKLIALSKTNINVISMHTNLDKVLVNKVLIRYLADSNYKKELDYMWTGELNTPISMDLFLQRIKKSLNAPGLRYYDSGRKVSKVACIGGAGDVGLADAVNFGADTFVTADIRHHSFLAAKEQGINLIDANHFSTENIVLNDLKEILSTEFVNLEFEIAESNVMVINYA